MPRRPSHALRQLLHPAYRRLERTVHPLRYLFLEITQRCNLRCRHCGSDCGREALRQELTTDEWLAFFDYLKGYLDTRRVVLVITGGEPLCHPELPRLLDRLAKHRLAFGMVTNAFALNDKILSRLLRAGISSVTVSLDGLEDSHDWLRGVKGSFRHALTGLKLLSGAGLPFFDVVTCVSPRNLEELPRVEALLRELQVPAWRLFSIFPRGRAREDRELLLDEGGWRRLFEFIRRARAANPDPGFSINFSCEGFLPRALDRQVRDEPYFCRAGISIGSVLCDGAISACPNISRSLVQGNIRTDDFNEVWEKRFAPFRERAWMRTGPCQKCGQWNRCLGNSLHLWDDRAGQTARCTFRTTTD